MVIVRPAGVNSSATTENQVNLTVSYIEQYKKPRNCKSNVPIQTSVTYSTGNLFLAGTSLFVPIIATITSVYLTKNGGTTMRTFAETFDIAFQGQDSLTANINIDSLGRASKTNISPCGVVTLFVDDSLIISLTQ